MKKGSVHRACRHPFVECPHYGESTMRFLSELRADDGRRPPEYPGPTQGRHVKRSCGRCAMFGAAHLAPAAG